MRARAKAKNGGVSVHQANGMRMRGKVLRGGSGEVRHSRSQLDEYGYHYYCHTKGTRVTTWAILV